MGILDFLSVPTVKQTELANTADALRYAKMAFKEFWDVAKNEYPENMQMTFTEFYAYMSQRSEETLIDFGKSVYRVGQGWGQSETAWIDAMQGLARASQGRVAQYDDGYPRLSDFYDALLGKMNEWGVSRISAAFGNVAKDTFEEATDVAATALTGYVGITAMVSIVGILIVILSFRKK